MLRGYLHLIRLPSQIWRKSLKSSKKIILPILLTGMQAPSSYGQDYQSSFNSIYPQLAKENEIFSLSFSFRGRRFRPKSESI